MSDAEAAYQRRNEWLENRWRTHRKPAVRRPEGEP
jgi:hypothetical protein